MSRPNTGTTKPRELDTREAGEKVKSWVKPSLLPDPEPEQGYVYRWVRINANGKADPTNFSSKIREGWEPVKAVDHPEIQLVSVEDDRFGDNVVMGGLMLCKMPSEIANQRDAYYAAQTTGQMQSVDNNLMSQSDARMPLFHDKKSEVKNFGNGT